MTANAKPNPILRDIPHALHSDRLTLRAVQPGDGKIIWPSVRDSLAELRPWLPWATPDYSEATAEEWCRRAAANFLNRTDLTYMILQRDGGQHLGGIGAFNFQWNAPFGEIGYWLNTRQVGRGYMTEAVNLLTQYLRDELRFRRIQICCDSRNQRSRQVAERSGYTLEGILRNYFTHDGAVLDRCVFARVWED